jgi:hypothetical protein
MTPSIHTRIKAAVSHHFPSALRSSVVALRAAAVEVLCLLAAVLIQALAFSLPPAAFPVKVKLPRFEGCAGQPEEPHATGRFPPGLEQLVPGFEEIPG